MINCLANSKALIFALAYIFYLKGIDTGIDLSLVGVLASVELVISSVLGWTILSEDFSFIKLFGVCLMMVSAYIATKSSSDESVQDEKILQEKAALDQVQEQLEKAQFSAEEAEEGMNAALKEVQRLNKNLNNTQQEYHMAHTKLESLRNLAERYDGYGNSIRRVMEVRDRIHGIRGVVADIISTDKKYETAIETALGGSIQNIVTDNEQTAKRMIEFLKKNKFEPITNRKRIRISLLWIYAVKNIRCKRE